MPLAFTQEDFLVANKVLLFETNVAMAWHFSESIFQFLESYHFKKGL